MGDAGEGKTVCVTGASGYIASWIVKFLLQRGYSVNATVRSLNDAKKTAHLLALDGAEDRLHLFEANLREEGSFDAAIQGCEGVFHTASPSETNSANPQEEIIDPAVKGTLNVLSSCAKNPSVKRVVLTSSMAAVLINGRPLSPEVVVDESWFSVPEFCEHAPMGGYLLSKTLAEEAAWKFTKEKGIDMVSINPSMTIGPLLQPILTSSIALLSSLVNGSETYPNLAIGYVNVKDVADAHIRAFETPSANGRYNLAESVAHFSEIVDILRKLYPALKLPHKCENDEPFMPTFKVSQAKVQSLGINYISLQTSLKETIECLKKMNLVTD